MPDKNAINQTDEHKARTGVCRLIVESLSGQGRPAINVRGHDKAPFPAPIQVAGSQPRVPNLIGGSYIVDVRDAGTIDTKDGTTRLATFYAYALQDEPAKSPSICVLAVPDDETSINDAKRLWARVVKLVRGGSGSRRAIWAVGRDQTRHLSSDGKAPGDPPLTTHIGTGNYRASSAK